MEAEGKIPFFVMNYFLGLIAESLLTIALKFETWNPSINEIEMEMEIIIESVGLLTKEQIQMLRDFLDDYTHLTAPTKDPNFIPRCNDFGELFVRYIAKESKTRIEIPENHFKVLQKMFQKNEFEESCFVPVFQYSLKMLKTHSFFDAVVKIHNV